MNYEILTAKYGRTTVLEQPLMVGDILYNDHKDIPSAADYEASDV